MPSIQLHIDADPDMGSRERSLVLLPGFSLEGSLFFGMRDGVRKLGATAVVDLLGHGRSPTPAEQAPYELSAYLDYCEDVLVRLGLSSAWWVGFSMGGFIVQRLALERPHLVEGLVLIATGPGLEDPKEREKIRGEELALAEGTEKHGMDWFFDQYYAPHPKVMSLPPDQRAAFRAMQTRVDPVGRAHPLRSTGYAALDSVWDRLPKIEKPTLVLCGEEDERYAPVAPRMAERLPRSRLEMIAGVGHTLVREKPMEMVGAFERFFADLP